MFRNKETGEIVKANGYAELFAFSHNSNYEKIEIEPVDDKDISKFNKAELMKYLTDLEIEFDKKMSKDELLALALNSDNTANNDDNLDDEDNEEIIVEDDNLENEDNIDNEDIPESEE